MSVFGRRLPAQPGTVLLKFAFCEPVTATSMSKWHIRRVGPEGLRFGGGVPIEALCGFDVRRGWDIEAAVTPEFALRLVTPRAGDGNVALCLACYEAWLTASGQV